MEALVFWMALFSIVLSYMTLWFGIALTVKRYDVVDTAWGLGFVLIAWMSLLLLGNFNTLQIITAILATIWGIRLFAHIANRNWRRSSDDPRYITLTKNWGSAVQHKAYTRIFLFQGLLIVLVGTPLVAIAFAHASPNLVSIIGWLIWISGILFETVADRQLASFIKQKTDTSEQIMSRGLWRYSRHPNYFGEITVWCGASIVAISVGKWWGIIGALALATLIIKISGIPPLERRYAKNKAYTEYAERTSILIPLPPKK